MMRGGRLAVVALLFVLPAACGPWGFSGRPMGDEGCARLGAVLERSFARDISMNGHVTLDFEQYRLRGRLLLDMKADGNATLSFSGTTGMGAHREDIVMSYYEGQVHLLDRERGEYYQGETVDSLATDAVGIDVRVTQILALVLGHAPACNRLTEITASETEVRGRLDGRPFRVSERDTRVNRAEWPAPIERRGERLEVDYRWEGSRLDRLTASVPGRGWRIRLSAD